MNKLLVRTLGFLNGFLAFLIIIIPTALGIALGPFHAFIGTLAGIAIAAVVCGLLAHLSLMEKHLETIAEASAQNAENLRFLAKSAVLQNAVAEMEIATQEEAERRRRAA